MQGPSIVKLIEELIDLKLQQQAEAQLKPTADVARLLEAKRQTDRRRLEQIRSELARLIDG